jgi:ubiquinone/menaquinone biosynthesis C-methylase UbiE
MCRELPQKPSKNCALSSLWSDLNEHFNWLAPIYDRVLRFDRQQKMRELLALPAEGRLLDAGGGTGRVSESLRGDVSEIHVADVSPGMLAQAKAKGLSVLAAYAEHLPFADGYFQRVLMVDALHHVIDQRATLAELWRVLAPGGRLVVEEPDVRLFAVKLIALAEKLALMRSHFLSPDEIQALLPPEAKITIELEGINAWVIAEK